MISTQVLIELRAVASRKLQLPLPATAIRSRGKLRSIPCAHGYWDSAVEAGEEVVITRRGQPVPRVVREHPQSIPSHDWPARLRALHSDTPQPAGSAVELLRELRNQE